MNIYELIYSNTNTYLIEGSKGKILFDTGWAGTFPAFCRCLGDLHLTVQEIDFVLISHYHPDHMGIAQEIADHGPTILGMTLQRAYLHSSDPIFEKEKNTAFRPIRDDKVRWLELSESREFLKMLGIDGEILHTPGHSEDSISLCLDSGEFFVGDLNPLYELELHKGTQMEESWKVLLTRNPKVIYYGHAKSAVLSDTDRNEFNHVETTPVARSDRYELVSKILKLIDKGVSLEKIQKKTGADKTFLEDVTRMYLTHQNVGVQGILDRIEIKGK